MPPSPFEQFAEQQPRFMQSFDAIADTSERILAKSERVAVVEGQLDRLVDTVKALQKRRNLHVTTLKGSIANNDELDDISFIAGMYASGVIDKQPLDTEPESLAVQFQESFTHMHASMQAAKRILARPDEPVVYLEIHGGETMFTIGGLQVRPKIQATYTAKSTGDGLVISANRDSGRFGVYASGLFGVKDESCDDGPANFVIGRHYNFGGIRKLDIERLPYLAGTAVMARTILGGSIAALQTNAVFVGSHAKDTALQFADRINKFQDTYPRR